MVKFPFVFLPKVKQYNSEHKFDGLKRYNGTGKKAKKYAETIIRRSLFYEELFAMYNTIPLDTSNFKNKLFDIINLTLLSRNEEPISNVIMDQLFSNIIFEHSSGYVKETYIHNVIIPVYEKQPLLAAQEVNYIIPADNKDYYIIVEEGHVIYQYFNDAQILFNVLSNKKNRQYYLYYTINKKKVIITSLKNVGNKKIYSNVKPGDKIYIPPGTILFSPETNLAVRIN
jgi:ABC-type transport system substrate-binding protein